MGRFSAPPGGPSETPSAWAANSLVSARPRSQSFQLGRGGGPSTEDTVSPKGERKMSMTSADNTRSALA